MVDQIQAYIAKYHMIEQGDTVFAGVSGGADSVCLMTVLLELRERIGFDMEVIHVEHGIRGKASRDDACFVDNLCRMQNIPFHMCSVDVPKYAKKHRLGMEEAARILRYQAFLDIAEESVKAGKKAKVALAHHMDDNAETILFQMIRGSGLKGMCGMQPVRQDEHGICYIRPMLCVSRSQIEAYLREKGMEYRTDATNFELDYSRNRIRNVILPQLTQLNTQAVPHIGQTAERLQEVWDFLESEVDGKAEHILEKREDTVILKADLLEQNASAVAKELVRRAIFQAAGRQKDITAVHVNDVLALCGMQSGKQIRLPYGIIARKEYDTIRLFGAGKTVSSPWEYEIRESELMPGNRLCIPDIPGGGTVTIRVMDFDGNTQEIPKKPYTKWLDYDMIKNGFFLRYRHPGDFFYADDKGHRKKLKEYFVNEKIPQEQRDRMLLAAKGSEVFAILGGRSSASCLVTEQTRYILEIKYDGGKE